MRFVWSARSNTVQPDILQRNRIWMRKSKRGVEFRLVILFRRYIDRMRWNGDASLCGRTTKTQYDRDFHDRVQQRHYTSSHVTLTHTTPAQLHWKITTTIFAGSRFSSTTHSCSHPGATAKKKKQGVDAGSSFPLKEEFDDVPRNMQKVPSISDMSDPEASLGEFGL